MSQQPDDKLREPVSEQDWPHGSEDAPVTMVEYGDYDCPSCRKTYRVVEELLAHQGDRVRFAYRHFPLTKPHPRALPAARAAEAAGRQGKFWQMHEAIFTGPMEPSDEQLHDYARRIGLDMQRFDEDFGDRQLEREILRRRMQGLRSGVNGTPTLFINGDRHRGEPTLEALTAAVELAAAQTNAN